MKSTQGRVSDGPTSIPCRRRLNGSLDHRPAVCNMDSYFWEFCRLIINGFATMEPNEIMALLCPSNNNSHDKNGRSDTLRVDVYGLVCCIPSSIYGRKHTLDRPRRVAVALWHSMKSRPEKALSSRVSATPALAAFFWHLCYVRHLRLSRCWLAAAQAALFHTIYSFVMMTWMQCMYGSREANLSFSTSLAC